MRKLLVVSTFGLLSPLTFLVAQAQPAPLQVTGAVAHPLSWSAAEVAQQPHITVKAKGKNGKTHRYSGIALSTILTAAGAVADNKLHGKELLKTLRVTGADGYEVAFALAELDSSFAPRPIILADSRDGQPLPAEDGPWEIIVPGEKKPGRWVRHVAALRVVE